MRTKSLVVLCLFTATMGVPSIGNAFVGPTSLGPASGSCRVERFDESVGRTATRCTITAASDTAAIAGHLTFSLLRPGGLEEFAHETVGPLPLTASQPKATFQGPGVSKSWDGSAVREIVSVTPGEQYVLTLNVEGNLSVISGATEADAEVLEGIALGPAGRVAIATGQEVAPDGLNMPVNVWTCSVEPGLEPSGSGFSFSATMKCEDRYGTFRYDGKANAYLKAANGATIKPANQKVCPNVGLCQAGMDYSSDDVYDLTAGTFYVDGVASFFLSPGEEVTRQWNTPCSADGPTLVRGLPGYGTTCSLMDDHLSYAPHCGAANNQMSPNGGGTPVNGVTCDAQKEYVCQIEQVDGADITKCNEVIPRN